LAGSEDITVLVGAAWTGLASSAMSILAAILAILMIRGVVANQEEKAQRLRDAGVDSPG
jgi:hypothetical protein